MKISEYANQKQLKLAAVKEICQSKLGYIPDEITAEIEAKLDGQTPVLSSGQDSTQTTTVKQGYLAHIQKLYNLAKNAETDIDQALFNLEQQVYQKIATSLHKKSQETITRISSNLTHITSQENVENYIQDIDPELACAALDFFAYLEKQ